MRILRELSAPGWPQHFLLPPHFSAQLSLPINNNSTVLNPSLSVIIICYLEVCVHSAGVPQGGGEGVEGVEGEAGHRGLHGTRTSLHLHSWGQASSQPLTQTAALLEIIYEEK